MSCKTVENSFVYQISIRLRLFEFGQINSKLHSLNEWRSGSKLVAILKIEINTPSEEIKS